MPTGHFTSGGSRHARRAPRLAATANFHRLELRDRRAAREDDLTAGKGPQSNRALAKLRNPSGRAGTVVHPTEGAWNPLAGRAWRTPLVRDAGDRLLVSRIRQGEVRDRRGPGVG